MNGNRRAFSLFSLMLAAARALAELFYFSFPSYFKQDSDRADFVFTILSPMELE
jgi:hypothetical protein